MGSTWLHRYFSFISYDENGKPIESVADYLIKPSTPGVVNPFLPGADRTIKNRGYTLKVYSGAFTLNIS